jgi:tight adherence protein B
MILLIIAVLFFISALLALITIYLSYAAVKTSPTYELRKRLRTLALDASGAIPSDLRIEILQDMSPIDKILYRVKIIRKLHAWLDKAGLKVDVKVFLLVVLVFASLGLLLGVLLHRGIIPPIILMIILASSPFIYLKIQITKSIFLFTEQLATSLDMMSRSLKAGHSLAMAIQVVGNEMADPISGLFKSVYEEQAYGLSIRDALSHMINRMDTPDMRFFVTAVNIYREIGGNLSEILENLAKTIRERLKIRRQVRVYTAQARLSGYILTALPIVSAIIFYLIAPDYMGELIQEKIGRLLIAAAIILQIFGAIIIKRIIDIKI